MMDDQIKLAVHENEIKHLQTDMDKLVKDMEELKASIAEISKTLAEAKGGWQVLMVMGGIGAAFGSVVGWAIEHFSGK
jgi:prefoldin subunit 5